MTAELCTAVPDHRRTAVIAGAAMNLRARVRRSCKQHDGASTGDPVSRRYPHPAKAPASGAGKISFSFR
jgi:hypothetical protein